MSGRATPKRSPLKFDIDASPATELEAKRPKLAAGAGQDEGRQQVGARIPVLLYRKLKSRAALDGEPVQVLVEKAIAAFLEAGMNN
jgi:hypothetical protein